MPSSWLIAALATVTGALAGVVLATLALRVRARRSSDLEARLAELQGRLTQFAEQAERGQGDLRRTLEERLDRVSDHVGRSLGDGQKSTSETLRSLHERLAVVAEAQKTLGELSSEVVGLRQILSNKQARGAFGEVQLRELIRDLLPPDAYVFNRALSNGRQPDAFIRLSGPPGNIAIDAKFPLESWRGLAAAEAESERVAAQRTFRSDLKRHIDAISSRYVIPGETADSALMFVPSEAVYAAIHADFAEIVDYGREHSVHLVSPTTMMALLTAIRAVLRDARMHEEAGRIQQAVGELVRDVERLEDRVGRLAAHLDQAREDVRKVEISTGKIVARGRRIGEVRLDAPGGAPPTLPAPERDDEPAGA